MSEPKNKGGRPRRAPGEKLQRVTLNLRPSIMFGLDLIARDRQTSLSQAAEYALATVLRSYMIDGKSAFSIASLGTVADDETGDPVTVDRDSLIAAGVDKSAVDKLVGVFEALHHSPEFVRALIMPDRLWTPEEKYMMEVLRGAKMMAIHDNWSEIYAVVREQFRLGFSVADAQSALAAMRRNEDAHKKPRTKRG